MNTQSLRFIALIVLSTLLSSSANAQYQRRSEPVLEGRTTDVLPLEVGNKWTYEHYYWNNYYSLGRYHEYLASPPLRRVLLRSILDIPGYPSFYESFGTDEAWRNRQKPPDNLTYITRRLTIEITHTEKIGNNEYFVFSPVEYDWPPVPSFFLAGKKVRFSRDSDEFNTLAFGEDEGTGRPDLYRFHPDDIRLYSVPDQPLLLDKNLRGTLSVGRTLSYANDNVFIEAKPLTHWDQEIVVSFAISSEDTFLGDVLFVTGYGLAMYDLSWWDYGEAPLSFFLLSIIPVSAVIGGKEIEFPYVAPMWTYVTSTTSWGQLKVRHGQ